MTRHSIAVISATAAVLGLAVTSALGQTPQNTNRTAYGCISLDIMKQWDDIAAQHDPDAYKAFYFRESAAGECTSIPSGASVVVTDATMFDYMRVRVIGSLTELWVHSDIVD